MGKKTKAIQALDRLGLNHHRMLITKDLHEIRTFAENCRYLCSIRTDRDDGIALDLPFHLIDSKQDFEEVFPKLQAYVQKGMILIISDGHFYDRYLRYNLVFSVDRNREFKAEFSSQNVPLRHMYRHPASLTQVVGNLDDRFSAWYIGNRAASLVDFREIRALVNHLFLLVDEKHLYNRHLELTVYKVPCGTRNEDLIFWEI